MKRMTSWLTPAVVAALLIALLSSIAALGTATAQTPTGQPPVTQTPTTQPTPVPPPATPAQPSTPQTPATPTPSPQVPTVSPAGQPPTATPPVGTDTDHGTALMLLDRIAAVLDAALKGKASTSDVVGTTGSDEAGAMKVVIDRAALDEMRAELTQIRLLLKNEKR